MRRRNTSYGRHWAVGCGARAKRKCLVQENVRKSSGLPNLPKGRQDLETFELEKMHVLNPIYPSRKLQKKITRIHGAACAKEPLENKPE